MKDRSPRLIVARVRLPHESHRRILRQQGLKDSDSGDQQAKATVKGAWIAAGTAMITVLLTGLGLSQQLTAAQDAANKSFTREIGTDAYTAYVAVLIDAETLFSQVRQAIARGVPSSRADQLKADVDAMLIRIKEDKASVDLVATSELREMADLTINLYGQIGGDIKYKLDQRAPACSPATQPEPPCGTAVLPDDFFGDNQVPDQVKDQRFMVHRITCAEEAGRIVFTETAQKLLELEVPEPDFSDACYTDWLMEEDKWHKTVREASK